MYISKDSKSPFYQITYFVNGKRTKKSTKTTDRIKAETFLHNFKWQLENKIEPEIKLTNTSILLSQFEEEYINQVSLSKSKHYVRSVKLSFTHFKLSVGNPELKSITTKQLDNFINTIYARSKSGAALYYRTLKAAFSKAVIWNYLDNNPLKKIKAPKTPSSLPLFIDENGLQKILYNTPRQFLKDIFTLGFYGGLRISEILNMKWSWIDFQKNIITTKISTDYSTKSKRERIIPIHKNIISILNRVKYDYSSSKEFIFSDLNGNKFNEDFISKQFKKAIRAAGLDENLHLHNLRHSFCSNLVQKGVSLYVVKELAGHQNITTTQIYSHLTQSSLSNAIAVL